MVQGFFLDRINAVATGTSIRGQNNLLTLIGAYKTQATLTFMQFTKAWTQIALYATVFQLVPVTGGYNRLVLKFGHAI